MPGDHLRLARHQTHPTDCCQAAIAGTRKCRNETRQISDNAKALKAMASQQKTALAALAKKLKVELRDIGVV